MASQGHSRAHLRQLRAEILQAEIDRLVRFQREIGGQHHRLEARADEGIEHQFADARQLAQARPQDERDVQHVAESALVCERAEKPSARNSSAMMPAITAPRR